MSPDRVAKLGNLGEIAGETLLNKFDFEEHRWRRFLATSAAVEKAFEQIVDTYDGAFRDFLTDYEDRFRNEGKFGSYPPEDLMKLQELIGRWDQMLKSARTWSNNPLRNDWNGSSHPMPRPRASLRFTPAEFVDPEL